MRPIGESPVHLRHISAHTVAVAKHHRQVKQRAWVALQRGALRCNVVLCVRTSASLVAISTPGCTGAWPRRGDVANPSRELKRSSWPTDRIRSSERHAAALHCIALRACKHTHVCRRGVEQLQRTRHIGFAGLA